MPVDFRKDKKYCHLTEEQVRRHFEVERDLARRILEANPNERASVILWAYDELFRQVPWHPALTEDSGKVAQDLIERRVRIFLPLLPPPPARILEIGCGMGELTYGLAQAGHHATGIDISDIRIQRLQRMRIERLHFVRTDTLYLPFAEGSFDAAISQQLLEHLHPDDAQLHMQEISRVLKKGGRYVLETPNKLTGPADVSRFFTDGEAEGFHLKEYRITEMVTLFRRHGFTFVDVVRWKTRHLIQMRAMMMEWFWALFPKSFRRRHPLWLQNPIYIAYKG